MWYVIDTYSPYEKNDDVVYKFEWRDDLWCVRAIERFEWGQPQFVERPLDDEYVEYKIYDNLEDAIQYCRSLKGVIV